MKFGRFRSIQDDAMPVCLVALDEGPNIPVDRAVVVVGRHPQCDARIDSIRVSRRHCCMTVDRNEVIVRDLGSTNGIRINGQRVEMGRLRPGDELAIAHIRYRLSAPEGGEDRTLADREENPPGLSGGPSSRDSVEKDPARLIAAAREMYGERCQVQVIVQVEPELSTEGSEPGSCPPDSSL